MSELIIHSTPKIQFPLRMNHELHTKFSNISSRTRIPMSTLGRLGIMRFLNEIELKGITRVLNEMEDL
jgi:predicted DNA-binding protein